MATSNTRFTQNSLGQSKTPIDSDHGIYRYTAKFIGLVGGAAAWPLTASAPARPAGASRPRIEAPLTVVLDVRWSRDRRYRSAR